MSAPTTPDLVTLRLPRDVAREYLRALEALISEADDASAFLDETCCKSVIESLDVAITDAEKFRDGFRAAIYCKVQS